MPKPGCRLRSPFPVACCPAHLVPNLVDEQALHLGGNRRIHLHSRQPCSAVNHSQGQLLERQQAMQPWRAAGKGLRVHRGSGKPGSQAAAALGRLCLHEAACLDEAVQRQQRLLLHQVAVVAQQGGDLGAQGRAGWGADFRRSFTINAKRLWRSDCGADTGEKPRAAGWQKRAQGCKPQGRAQWARFLLPPRSAGPRTPAALACPASPLSHLRHEHSHQLRADDVADRRQRGAHCRGNPAALSAQRGIGAMLS